MSDYSQEFLLNHIFYYSTANAIHLIPLEFSKCKFLNSYHNSLQEIYKVKISTTNFMCILQTM